MGSFLILLYKITTYRASETHTLLGALEGPIARGHGGMVTYVHMQYENKNLVFKFKLICSMYSIVNAQDLRMLCCARK